MRRREFIAVIAGAAMTRPLAAGGADGPARIALLGSGAALAVQHRIPAFSSIPELTDAGRLAGYEPPRLELYRRSASYVKRILDGVKPADLPVEQPTRVELSVNLRSAKRLGLAIPEAVLRRADRVIE